MTRSMGPQNENGAATRPGRKPGPLDGLTVLDLSAVILGPMAGQYLGDMGADVIKIETPEGDVTRAIGPRRNEGMGAMFLANNRNKRSVVLDLKTAAGGAALRHLAARADVLLHSTRARAAERIGLGYPALAADNPRLVYCHVRGFGADGPYRDRAAYDDIIQALSGLAMLQKVAAGAPRYVPSIVCDKITSVHAAYAITLALFHRERTGRGQEVVVPMFETMAAFNLQEHLGGAVFEPIMGEFGYGSLRYGVRRPYPTKDGFLCFLPYNDANWATLLRRLGRADWAADPRFATQRGRQANMAAIWAELAVEIAARTNAEWEKLLEGSDIPNAALNDLEDLLDDPHLVEAGFWRMFEHDSEGEIRLPAPPLVLTDSPPSIRRLPPRHGEHTEEVLREAGVDPAVIEAVLAGAPARDE